jgi:hypothetical protein
MIWVQQLLLSLFWEEGNKHANKVFWCWTWERPRWSVSLWTFENAHVLKFDDQSTECLLEGLSGSQLVASWYIRYENMMKELSWKVDFPQKRRKYQTFQRWKSLPSLCIYDEGTLTFQFQYFREQKGIVGAHGDSLGDLTFVKWHCNCPFEKNT